MKSPILIKTLSLFLLLVLLTQCGKRKRTQSTNINAEANLFAFQEPLQWKAFGPFGSPIPLAPVNAISPHGAGRFMCVNVHPKNSNEILIGHATSGLFKSNDGGKTWEQKLPFDFATGIFSIVRFRLNPKHLIACSAMDIGNSKQYGYGLFESFDAGETWQRNSLQFDPEEYNLNQCRDVAIVNRNKETRLISVSSHDIYSSDNAGLTWTKTYESKYNLKNIAVDPNDENRILVFGNGVLYSKDNGKTWIDLSAELSTACGMTLNSYVRMAGAFSVQNPGKIYLVNQQVQVHVLEMEDKEKRSYKLLNNNNCQPNSSRLCLSIAKGEDKAVETIWLGTTKLYASTDNGMHFKEAASPIVGSNQHIHDDINAIYLQDKTVYVATDGGVDYSIDNGVNWISLTSNSTNLNTTLLFGFDKSKAGIVMCGTQDNGIFVYKNKEWFCSSMYGDGGRVVSIDDSAKFACSFAQMNFVTSDAGNTYLYKHAGNEKTGFDYRMDFKQNSNTFYIANMNLYKKRDDKYYEILSSNIESDRKIKAFWVDPNNEKSIWICRDDATWGKDLKNKLMYTQDGGQTWVDKSKNLTILNWRSITDIHINRNGDIAISVEAFDKNGGDLNKVFISQDGGDYFENISAGLPNLPVNTIVYADNNWVCGSNNSVYILKGKTWQKLGVGLPATIISELRYFEEDNTLWAATFGRGLWGVKLN